MSTTLQASRTERNQGRMAKELHPKRVANPNKAFVSTGDKELRALQKAAWDAGWWPVEKRNGISWLAPTGGGSVLLHGSHSDHRAIKNARSKFRQCGLRV